MRKAVLRWGAGIVLAGTSALLWSSRSGPERAYSEQYKSLLDSIGSTRPIEARLSGGLSYKPYQPPSLQRPDLPGPVHATTRGAEAPPESTAGLYVPPRVVAAIRGADTRNPTPENHAASAVLSLLQGDSKGAITTLRQAHDQKPDDPRILSDLSAALLAASSKDDPWPAIEAVDAAEQSVGLEASAPAQFNKALALEKLGTRARAIAAWRRYRELDSRSPWYDEASRRLQRLVLSPPAPFNPGAARQLGETSLLTKWADETLADREGEADLSRAEALAASLGASGRLLKSSVAAIREAQGAGDRRRIDLLARGHQAFGRAYSRFREERTGEAQSLVETAVADLRAANSPFELRARILRAWAAAEPDWGEIEDLGLAADQGGFPTIAAEVRRITAFRISMEGRFEPAVDVYRDARRRFDALGEWESSAVIAGMTSELLGLLSREEEAASELAAALRAAPAMADPWNRYSTYVVATTGAAGRYSRAAVELRLEAADACRAMPRRPLCPVDSWLRVAALTPDAGVAEDALDRAARLLADTPDVDGKERTKIDLAMTRARRLSRDESSASDKEEAAGLLGQVLAGYQDRGLAVPAARTLAARASVYQSLGRDREASADYRSALGLLRSWDKTDPSKPDRAEKPTPRDLRQVYGALLKIEVESAGDRPSAAAFLLSEEMRDRLSPRRGAGLWLPHPSEAGRLAAAVPADTAIVEYAVLGGGKAVAWVLAGGRLEQVALAPGVDVGKTVRSLGEVHDLDTWKSTSAKLYEDLLAPALARLPAGTKRLVLVPDSELYGLPFRALWNSASGRYLDEAYQISLAPSVRQYLGPDAKRSPEAASGTSPVLSLGFSTFSPVLGLKELPLAPTEAAEVRQLYDGHVSADCEAVTGWEDFRRCAPQAAVIHLSTHAAAESPRSWLAFERETVTLDRLWDELPDLPQHPLVVLSACQSVAAGSGEGLGGLARPFLARGARAVVGTLWKIHDEDAAELFSAFHQAHRRTRNPAAALREARKDLEEWQERPWGWGAVEEIEAGER